MNKAKWSKKLAKACHKVQKLIEKQDNALVQITAITIRYTDSETDMVNKK